MTSSFNHMHDFFRPSSTLSIDSRHHNLFDDDESSILDDNILEPGIESALDMSPLNRRDSFVDSTTIFSPKVEWGDFDRDMTVPDRLLNASTNPFEHHEQQSNNPFMRLEAAQVAAYGHQTTSSWAMEAYSGSCTPTAVYDTGYPSEFESNTTTSYLTGSGATPGPTTYESHSTNHIRPVSVFPSAPSTNASIPPSPHQSKDWMPTNGSAEQLEPRSIPKRMRPGSPSPRSNSPLLRRDGIRKKNARFEIPAERNLLNIDQLIAQSADDQEIKELKQQKRLLRNRQAALDSRQRKKQHTERLEEEKKQYTTIISELEERLAQLEVRETEHIRQEEEWKTMQQRYDQYIQNLQLEKEEMVRSHTLETGDLRKKNAYLTDHIQKMDSTAMSAVPSSSGFSNEFSDMDNMTVDGFWENPSYMDDFSMDTTVRSDSSLIKKSTISDDDKPAASGLLLILLLCGAFVASKSSTTSTPAIPRMPEDIRVASAAVLDNIFKDAGVQQSDPRLALNRVESLEPTPSGVAWPAPKNTLTAAQMVGLSGSSLDVLNHQLVQPTKEQEQEQLFSLSADQYNGVTSQDFGEPEPSTSRGRRNLEESLAAMRNNNKGSAAEVYTRSLLWDKVPAEVVRDFAKLVSESNSRNGEHQNGDSMG
ncbi:MAG: hypothetical protein M1839_003624 [Geoglossum umbratile]|nr:MAG: hypothetical protein M1839_003624 [Geoglossum umbratile]